MKLKSMHLEFFKGVTDKTYDFFDRTKVSAENGEGKSTIADAHFWLWCGRNYELVNEPNIKYIKGLSLSVSSECFDDFLT